MKRFLACATVALCLSSSTGLAGDTPAPDGAEELEYGLPADENHVHFGGGQTEVSLDLALGQHTLQLVLGDMNHVPHDPPVVSDVITITVE